MRNTTPGHVCYEAWWHCRWPLDTPPHFTPYADLRTADRAAWEAAAQAAIAQWWRDHETVICGDEEHDNG